MRCRRIPDHRAGFTLLEVLVALTILAVGATGLIGAVRQSLLQEEALETRTLASWVAENRLAELRAERGWPDMGTSTGHVSMAGRDWSVRVGIKATPNPYMRKIEVAVAPLPAQEPVATLIGFLGKY